MAETDVASKHIARETLRPAAGSSNAATETAPGRAEPAATPGPVPGTKSPAQTNSPANVKNPSGFHASLEPCALTQPELQTKASSTGNPRASPTATPESKTR